ncbi:TetR/AcrR family transcriptional regulator [Cohnella nanjingensis]|uniref:TetR/AcrR family transcriptional regulator n=1 Tax=Cohnella nanjingensis TaxID=1387779 RepID=A0A7X0RQ90_9BACL|nr:TetR/AcrR family transcriptional regulator [Cohnella nanjingensis]MBB6671570.1 TetR/AcrR family transcriptional regulator [Cohnella nanjingensis]
MDNSNLGSSDRLLLAAINLISERGYNGVTTQEIATAAGLSEKTLFRHFGTKQKLLEAAFDRYHYAEEMKKLFKEKLVWDLETDLLTVCRTYHEIMNRNRKMIQISLKDEVQLPGFKERTQQHPLQLLEILTNYFIAMGEQGKMIRTNPEMQAFAFMMAHFGAFINDLDAGKNYPHIKLEPFMQESVRIFARALTP